MENDPSQTVEIVPLKTVAEVLSWTPNPAFKSPENLLKITRSGKYLSGSEWVEQGRSWDWLVHHPLRLHDKLKPRTLVCHDMMGGYIEDRFLQPVDKDSYSLLHWSSLDIFVYFSHHFLTIPPPGWISAAQKHGVSVLGTIITEWEAGQRLLQEILGDPTKMDGFVEQCARIAQFHGFQGWLLNIENPVEERLVPQLISLVRLLRDRMKEVGEDCLVLWYDSVTIQGKLEWQNEVNPLNKPFLDNCDGIFLNYTWRTLETSDPPVDSLERTVSALGNDPRRSDIFVGVDVFGRGCIGGGGFNCSAALDLVRARDLSCAIFAPGWTYEIPHRENAVGRDFFWREHLFWSRLEQHLSFHALRLELPGPAGVEKEWGAAHQFTPVFRSSFSSGRGGNRFHLSALQTQPTLTHLDLVSNKGCPGHPYINPLLHLAEEPGTTHSTSTVEGTVEADSPSFSQFLCMDSPSPSYCCHTTDTKAYEEHQSICLSVETSGTVIPLLLVDMEPRGADLLFVLLLAGAEDPPHQPGGTGQEDLRNQPGETGPEDLRHQLEGTGPEVLRHQQGGMGHEDIRHQPGGTGQEDLRHQPGGTGQENLRHQLEGTGQEDLRHQPGGTEDNTQPVVDLVLGTDTGSAILIEELSEAEMFPLVNQHFPPNKEKWRRTGYLLRNCHHSIEKVGLRARNCTNFYLGHISILYR